MKPVLSPKEMAKADAFTIQELGIEGIELMARAGKACVKVLLSDANINPQGDQLVLAVAGTGNNGGDAFVMAEILRQKNFNVKVVIFGEKEKIKPDARYFFELFKNNGGNFITTQGALDIPPETTWILDGLLGTGLDGPVRGPMVQWIDAVNQSPARVFSIDIPSGSFPGVAHGQAIQANLCTTFQALKPVHVISPGCYHCGEMVLADIGIQQRKGDTPNIFALEAPDFAPPVRSRDSHKGVFGTLGVFGGGRGMEGAAALAGLASLRMGAGKTRIYTENPSSTKYFHAALMVDGWEGDLRREAYNAWVVGPGLSRNPGIEKLLMGIDFKNAKTIWDADGLFFFSSLHNQLSWGAWVITPHPGEAAHLLGTTSKSVQANREHALLSLGSMYSGGWIVLKGDRTMILSPEGTIFVCMHGSPSLGVAGSGDVLAGMIGGQLAQNIPVRQAVFNGVIRHALAGENWSRTRPDYAMLPEDIIADLTQIPTEIPILSVVTVTKGYHSLYE